MRNKLTFILFGLLAAVGWTSVMAQGTSTVSPLQRLNLTLVDNVSNYNIDQQQNEYTNTLRITQGDNKLTAGMLNEGNNYIVVSRQGDTETQATECARVNLNAEFSSKELADVTALVTYNENPPSSAQTYTPDDPSWSATGCIMQTNGAVYIQNGGSLTYTIPAGYENANFLIGLYAGSNLRNYYFAINNYVINVTQSGWVSDIRGPLSSGDQIVIDGARKSGNSYYSSDSPDLIAVEIIYIPPQTPSITVTPYIGQNAGTSQTYSPNDILDLTTLGIITDQFTQSTQSDGYPSSYTYKAELEANVEWPSTGATTDFYASVDFTQGDGEDLSTCAYVGSPDYWGYNIAVAYYTDVSPVMYLTSSSDFIYTMPPTFTGNSVNVRVTASTGSYGAGDLMVNGINHTFTAGSSYTWNNIPVMAGGVIPFAMNPDGEDGYTGDIAKIEIFSGNGTALNAPKSQPGSLVLKKKDNRFDMNKRIEKSQIKKMRVTK